MFQKTTALQRIATLNKRIRAVQGGTAAGKTIAILTWLISLAQQDKEPTLTSVVSESFPHLKRGAIRDFLDILKKQGYYKDKRWNRTDYYYEFETGSKIEFFSADQPDKVRGPRRDRLFINEANNVPFETYEQLEVRTREFIFLDWNPVAEFWVYDEVIRNEDIINKEHIILTYKDNEALDQAFVESIETRMNRKGWWTVYGMGELGEVEGKIYRDWKILGEDEMPKFMRLERIGIDFGYTNDPTAIVAIYYADGGYIVDEIAHRTKMTNKEIADTIQSQERDCLVIADSAEPKSIDEIRSYGINIQPADKGKDSVVHGIQLVQEQQMAITQRSINVIKEYRNYLWKVDKDGKILNEPEHDFSHSMDAIRYAITSMRPYEKKVVQKASDPLPGFYPEMGI